MEELKEMTKHEARERLILEVFRYIHDIDAVVDSIKNDACLLTGGIYQDGFG